MGDASLQAHPRTYRVTGIAHGLKGMRGLSAAIVGDVDDGVAALAAGAVAHTNEYLQKHLVADKLGSTAPRSAHCSGKRLRLLLDAWSILAKEKERDIRSEGFLERCGVEGLSHVDKQRVIARTRGLSRHNRRNGREDESDFPHANHPGSGYPLTRDDRVKPNRRCELLGEVLSNGNSNWP
jgi:hypothetical protein